jgi:DDE superfamily endonuclease
VFYRAALPLSHQTRTFVCGLLAARAPKLRGALRKAKRAGMAYVVIDGTLIPIDRIAADRPVLSGKHNCRGVNPQVIASPGGTVPWVSSECRGSTHDTARHGSGTSSPRSKKLGYRVGRQGPPRLRADPGAGEPLHGLEQTRIPENPNRATPGSEPG